MQLFKRLFAILMAIAWGALLGWLLWVVWRPSQSASIDGSRIHFSLGLSLTTSEQILGTIILIALMVPALLLFGIEVFGVSSRPARERIPTGRDGDRYRTLESRLDRLERQAGMPADAAETPPEQVEETPPPSERKQGGLFRRFRRHDRAQTA